MTRAADKRTALDITLQRYTHLLGLTDHDLCREDHRTAAIACIGRTCTRSEITDQGHVQACTDPGGWGIQVPGSGVRRLCTQHAAGSIRARLWLQRQRLLRGTSHD